MLLQVMFVFFGTLCAASTQFKAAPASIFEGFQNPLQSEGKTETTDQVQSLSNRIEKESSENKEAFIKLTAEVQAVNELVSSLTEKISTLIQTTGTTENRLQKSEQQAKLIESAISSAETTTNEVAELKGSLMTVRAEAEQTKTKVAAMEQSVQAVGGKVDSTKIKLDASLGEVKDEVAGLHEAVQEQCSNADHQNAVLLETLQVPRKLDTLAFTSASGSTGPLEALKAIDGNRNPNFRDGSCTHTNPNDMYPWWQGKLSAESEVHKLILTNRGDCCPERLQNFKVESFMDDPVESKDAKAKLCKEVQKLNAAVVTIECDRPIIANYIRITKQNESYLTLCEVDVEGFYLPKQPQGLAIQSSLASPFSGAMMATDKDPVTCSETVSETEQDQWWQVDLTAHQIVTVVSITNRKDDKHTLLSNFEVILYEALPSTCTEVPSRVCASFDGVVAKGQAVTLTCESPVTGRYMRIRKKSRGALSLCEVDIKTVN